MSLKMCLLSRNANKRYVLSNEMVRIFYDAILLIFLSEKRTILVSGRVSERINGSKAFHWSHYRH